ncbi:tryptophan synthase, alpha chain [Bacillus sp. OV322]|uniref:tryptophan synthase subunit alpha n=1 Tax=Bacillus sp. OV322 TaxID=1882764 RepID=UPI0008E37F42|nr:tryptophan synthase subunit alpha [Bacillus sp. OV322]SFC04195.1 tryptophan synthase, alpha chain [Bacillus sp. OV322]
MNNNRVEKSMMAVQQKGEKAFIPYIMAGDGGLEKLKSHLQFFEAEGADAVELGIPFSDPVADGPVIQRAGIRALQEGTTLKKILDKLKEIKGEIRIPVILMAYMNSILVYGAKRFVNDCKSAGVDGCIVPDLPIEEEEIISGHLKEAGIVLIRLVTLTSTEQRIKKIAERAEGFLYAVTVKGTTGVRNDFGMEAGPYLEKVKKASGVPVLAGFGISSAEQVKELSKYCDGVIVGSKIIDCLEREEYKEISRLISAAKMAGARQ